MNATDSDSGGNSARVPALDPFRPPEEQQVLAYKVETEDGIERVELDTQTPVSEIPSDADPSRWITSMSTRNDERTFAIARCAYNTDPDSDPFDRDWEGVGVIEVLAPSIRDENDDIATTTHGFDTWQDAEAYIAEHFDQPDEDGVVIRPYWLEDLLSQSAMYLMDVEAGKAEPNYGIYFHRNTPVDEAFYPE